MKKFLIKRKLQKKFNFESYRPTAIMSKGENCCFLDKSLLLLRNEAEIFVMANVAIEKTFKIKWNGQKLQK